MQRAAGYRDDLMLKPLRLKGLDQLARQHRDAPLVSLLVEAAASASDKSA